MSNISELARLAASGDSAAFERFYEQTKSGVWFTCKSLLKNEENAKDIMQDTYLAAFEKLGTLADFSGVQGWLNKIAANKCKNFIKSKANSALAEDSEEILENIPDDNILPEEYVADEAKRKIIMDIIGRVLSEEQYRTIILYYFDEMTAAEIAELMNVHEKTVLYRLKVARAKIKEEIMRYEEENKDKLHGVVFIPTLTRLFRLEAENTPVPNVPLDVNVKIPPNTQTVPSEQAALSGQTAAKQGGKAMLNTLKAKIIAGACAAVVVGGGVTAGVLIANNAKDNESFPTYSAGTNTSKPAAGNISKPVEESAPADSAANSTTASATTSGSMVEGDYEYAPLKYRGKVDDSAVMITKYNGSGGHVTVPSTLGGKPVKSINNAFKRCKDVTRVTIPEGVLYIEMFSFSNCEALETIDFPDSLQVIGPKTFEDCESLVTVTLPENLNEIGYEAFNSCDSLKTVYLNDNLHILGTKLIRFSYNAEVIYKGQSYNEDTFDQLIATHFNGDPLMPGQ